MNGQNIRIRLKAFDHRILDASTREIVFTRNATEAINLVAASFLRPQLQPGDEILVTEMEHHANIVPWQMAAGATGAKVVAAPVNDAGELLLDGFVERISQRTRMIAVVWVSNVLGTQANASAARFSRVESASLQSPSCSSPSTAS